MHGAEIDQTPPASGSAGRKVAYLGPPGTFSEDALVTSGLAGDAYEAVPVPNIGEVVAAVADGVADRALVPVENSIEGSVRSALDTLAARSDEIAVIAEYDHPVRSSLIARSALPLESIEVVVSHPQPLAQCANFLRAELGGAEQRVADSTATAVREVSEAEGPWAALGTPAAAAIYGCEVLRDGIEDEPGNVTRFLWLAPRGTPPERSGGGRMKTMIVFAELGADHPGALVEALLEFSGRGANLTRIESRPLRRELGRYMFFIDVEGGRDEAGVAGAIAGLRTKADWVRVLGSFPLE